MKNHQISRPGIRKENPIRYYGISALKCIVWTHAHFGIIVQTKDRIRKIKLNAYGIIYTIVTVISALKQMMNAF